MSFRETFFNINGDVHNLSCPYRLFSGKTQSAHLKARKNSIEMLFLHRGLGNMRCIRTCSRINMHAWLGMLTIKNSAYWRHRISRPMRIVGPIQFWRGCATVGVHFWPPLLGSTFDRHFWGPFLSATFDRR